MVIVFTFGIVIEFTFFFSVGFDYLKFFGLALIIFIGFILEIKLIIMLLLFLLVNQRLLIIPNTEISLINIYVYIILLKSLYRSDMYVNSKVVLVCATLVAYVLVSTYVCANLIDVAISIKVVSFILMFSCVSKAFTNRSELYIKSIFSYCYGCIIAGGMGLLFDPNFSIGTKDRFSGGDFNNPNDLAMMLVFAISVLLIILDKTKNKYSIILMIIIITFFGLLTQSRVFIFGWILIFVVITVQELLMIIYMNKIRVNLRVILGIVLLVMILIFFNSFQEAFSASLDRIIHARHGDISGSRFEIWQMYYNSFMNNKDLLLFGVGLSNTSALGNGHVAHNFIIELLASWGIFGLVIIVLLYSQIFKTEVEKTKGSKIINLKAYIPLVVLLVLSMTRHNPLNIAFIVQLYLSIYAINYFILKERY